MLMLIAGGGFALKFTPFGMFGVHFFEGFTSAAGSPASAEAALSDATDAAKDDSYAGGRAGLRVLSDARQREYVNRALLAGSAAREALFQVRFGEDSASEARERRILTRLETRGNDAPNMTLALAASALRSGDLAQARTLLGAAQGSGSLLGLIRGELARAAGQHEAALESFGTLPDDDVRGLWGVARASMALDQGVDEALDAVLAANANHAGALVAKARRIANAQPDEARGLAERAAQRGEAAGSTAERAEAYALVGSIHETEGRRSDARRAFVAARTLVPFHVEALLGLGRLGLRERRFRDALTQYQAAQQAAAELTQPIEGEMLKADQAKLGAAQALIALDSPQEALTIMSALRATYGSRSDVALVHGRVLQKLEQTAEAAAAFEAAYAASPEFFEPYMAHAQLLSASGNDEAARAVLARARDTVEMTADVRRQLGDGSLAADDFDEAEREYRAALELESANVDALFGLGVALRSKRRYRSAEEVMEQLAAVDPGFPGLALERGRIFEALGQA
ncbi:MAG: tetratricopeptide repeat protein, partial [Myxococcota bacterium]